MDKETEALFYAIWFPFLLELAKVYIFPRDVCSSLGDDIEVQLKRFIITGQPIPNTIDMANQIRGHCKMGTFAALETVIHEFLNFQLVTLWIEYERTGVNRSNWQGAPNLLQSTLQPADLTNTENYKNFAKTKKLERVDPSGTVDYGRIIDSSFASVATTSTREDQTVPNQANINVLVNELPDGRLQIGRQGLIAMDNESEAHFYAIWLPFLMGLAKACVFPRHICSSLGDDIEVQLKAFIVTGQPVPNARYMTNRIRHVTGGFHYKNAHFTALMDKLEEKVQKHLIAHLFRLRNEYNMLAGVNGCEWHSGFNLQQPAVESMNTENCGNSDQERVVPSGTVDYGRIIDSSFASVTTYSTGGDWTVTCQASANVAVNELPDESVQIGRQGGIADRNLGPSTSQCSSSAAANKYEPIWLPMPGWPQTVSHFFNEIKQFLLALSGRKFYYVPQEEPILRKYERRDNVDQRGKKDEAELADLVAKTRRGQGTSADKKRIEKLKCQVRQSKNAKRKREAKKNELQIRKELLKALQKELGRYQKAMKSTREWIQALPDEFLRSKLEETVLAICDFVGKKRDENEETLVPKKVTDNKYQLQMASWKGECDILRELRELLERLIHMEDELSDERSEEVTISSMKRRSQTHLDEPATKKSTSAMKDNSLVLNINYTEEETTNEDFQWLEPNSTTASSMFPEARTLPELLKIGVRVELDKESCEEVYAERSLKAQEQEEGDQQQNDYWDVVLDKNLRNSRDTSSPSMALSPAHNCPDAVPQMDNDNDQDYQ